MFVFHFHLKENTLLIMDTPSWVIICLSFAGIIMSLPTCRWLNGKEHLNVLYSLAVAWQPDSHLLTRVSSNWPQLLTGVSDLLEMTLDYSSRWLALMHISREFCIKMSHGCF